MAILSSSRSSNRTAIHSKAGIHLPKAILPNSDNRLSSSNNNSLVGLSLPATILLNLDPILRTHINGNHRIPGMRKIQDNGNLHFRVSGEVPVVHPHKEEVVSGHNNNNNNNRDRRIVSFHQTNNRNNEVRPPRVAMNKQIRGIILD